MLFKIRFLKVCFSILVFLVVSGLFSLQFSKVGAEPSSDSLTNANELALESEGPDHQVDILIDADSNSNITGNSSNIHGSNLNNDQNVVDKTEAEITESTGIGEAQDKNKSKNKDKNKDKNKGKNKDKNDSTSTNKIDRKNYPSSGSFSSPAMNGYQSRASLPLLPSSRIKSAPLPSDLSSLKFKNKLIRTYGKNLVKVTKRIDNELLSIKSRIETTTANLSLINSDVTSLAVYKIELDVSETYDPTHYSQVVARLSELRQASEETEIALSQAKAREIVLNSEKSRIYEILGFYKAVDNLIYNTPFPKSQVKPLILSTAAPFPSFPSKNLQSRDWNSLHGLTYSDIGPSLLANSNPVLWKAPIFDSFISDSVYRSLSPDAAIERDYSKVFSEMENFNPLLAVRVDESIVNKIIATPYADKILALPVSDLKVGGRVLTVAGVDDKAATILDLTVPPTELLAVFSTGAQSALSIKSGDIVYGQNIKHSKLTHGGIEPFKSKRKIKTPKTQLTAGAFQDLPLGVGALVNIGYFSNPSEYIVLFNNDTDFRNTLSYLDKFTKNKTKENKILRKTAAPSYDMFYSKSEAAAILGSGSFVKANGPDPDAIALPSSFVSKHIKTNKFPVLGVFPCSRFGAKQLAGALAHAAVSGLGPSLIPSNFGGCFSSRFMRTQAKPSYHAWGLAIDLDPSNNQLYAQGTLDRRLVPIFKSWGFRWGGDWRTLDPMHFEIAKLLK